MTGVTSGLQVAVVGFVGVLVGAVVAALAQFILAIRHEHREDKANGKSLKRSARLVANELGTAHGAILSTLQLGHWTFAPSDYETNAWLEHQGTLAGELSESAFEALTLANWTVVKVREIRLANIRQSDPQWSLTADHAPAVERALNAVEIALAAIKPYESDAPVRPPNFMRRFMRRRRSPEP